MRCRDHYPHSFAVAGGKIERSHGKPMEGGYYTDWDPFAGSIELKPVEAVNPTCTQHVLVATVYDKEGVPLPSRRVEWMITDPSVGAFVEVDASGATRSRGHKIDNHFAVTHTNLGPHVMTRGNDDPEDDIHLKKGDTWAVITSPVEGVTHVVAYAPGIFDWSKHKAFARKYWIDAGFTLSPPAVNPVGTTHTFTVTVARADKTPIPGAAVTFKIISGPAARFANDKTEQTIRSDAKGKASVVLEQVKPVAGVNQIQAAVRIPAPSFAGGEGTIPLGVALTSKKWLAPGIDVAKTAPATALVGETFTYPITVTSTGAAPAENVVLTDSLPDGVSYVSSSPKAKASGKTLTWKMGTIADGGKKSVTVKVRAERTGRVVNTATVTADHGLKDTAAAPTVIAEAKIDISKTGTKSVESVCEPIEYVVTVSNPGTATAKNVVVTDTLPKGMTSGGKSTVTYKIGDLAKGASKTMKVPAKVSKPGTYTNTAAVTADGNLKDSAKATTKVMQPKLQVTKTGPKMRFLGREATYKITVKNVGDGPCYDMVVIDRLPQGLQFVSASGKGKCVGGTITWPGRTLRPGKSISESVTTKCLRQGSFKDTVSASGRCCPKAGAEATTVVKGIPALLLECVDTTDPVELGKTTTYRISVTNQGTASDSDVRIVCTIPNEMALVSANGKPQKAGTRSLKFDPVKVLEPGRKQVFTVTVKGTKAADCRFKVSMTSKQVKKPVTETESTHIYGDN